MDVKEPTINYGWHNDRKLAVDASVRRVSVSVPITDFQLLKSLVRKMGWVMHPEDATSYVTGKKKAEALKRLQGCVNLSSDYNYEEDIVDAFLSKYEKL